MCVGLAPLGKFNGANAKGREIRGKAFMVKIFGDVKGDSNYDLILLFLAFFLLLL